MIYEQLSDDSDGQDCCGSSKARSRSKGKDRKPTNKPKVSTVPDFRSHFYISCTCIEFQVKRNCLRKHLFGQNVFV